MENGEVMSANELETLFLDWWNFPGAMEDQQFGRAKTLQRLARDGNDLNRNLSVPFLSSVIRHTTQLNSLSAAAETFDEIGEKVSLLDRYLLSRSSIDELIDFEKLNRPGFYRDPRVVFSARTSS